MKIDLSPRQVSGIDLKIGRLVMGTMTFGSQVNETDGAAMVRRCMDAGITMFDTAHGYNAGASEEMLGRIVKPFRSRVQIVTKVGMSKTDDRPLRRESMIKSTDISLKRLGMECVDVLYLHTPDHKTPFEEQAAALDEIVKSGRAIHVAQSNHAAWQVTRFHALSDQHGSPKMRISQQMHSLLARRVEGEFHNCARYLGLFNIVYNPLAGGLLTGKHGRGSQPPAGTRFAQAHYQTRYWNDQQFAAVEQLKKVADRDGLTMIQLAFRWLLSHPMVDSVVLGASSMQQLEANLAAASGAEQLSAEALRGIDEIWSELRGVAPNYYR